ncbi:MAG: GGDEF domain-containing protein [Abditibacteriota bacterium]|nr:GGDEF domain-containing protein [Abditibacteriota bacterium]
MSLFGEIFARHLELPVLSLTVIVLAMINLSMHGGEHQNGQIKPAERLMLSSAVFIVFYVLWDIFYEYDLLKGVRGFYTVNYLYNCAAYSMVWTFFSFCFATFRTKGVIAKRFMLACHILFTAVSVLYWAFMGTGRFVTITPEGLYAMGPLDLLWYAAEYLPMLMLAVHSLYAFADKYHYTDREEHAGILVFIIVVNGAAFFDQMFLSAHLLLIGLTVGVMVIYFQTVGSFIQKDSLTGLYNRRRLNKDMEKRLSEKKKWVLIAFDLDGFKKINDTFGHDAGDSALIRFARVLRDSCKGRDAKAYREGGDEFFIIMGCRTVDMKKELDDIKNDIARRLQLLNKKENIGYSLTAAVGLAPGSRKASVKDIKKAADSDLYRNKAARQ